MATNLTPRNLLKAAGSGDVGKVMRLVNVSSTDKSVTSGNRADRLHVTTLVKKTALHLAAEENNRVAIRTLVRAGADINLKDMNQHTSLIVAIMKQHLSCVAELIKLGADINNCRDFEGRTPLMLTALCGMKDYIQLLIKAGADLKLHQIKHDQGDFFGPTALMLAAQRPDVDCLKLLLKAGANVNVKTSDGKTALMFAAESGEIQCLKYLLEAGGDVKVKTLDGMTALHYACKGHFRLDDAVTFASDCVKILIDSGSDVKTTDTKGQTVLMYAVRDNCKVHLLSVLVEAGVVIGQQDFSGRTALAHAVSWGSHKCVRWLIDHEASVNICDYSGKTLLHYLMSDSRDDSNTVRCLEILISKQLDVNATDKDGMTPLMYVARESGEETATMDMLLQHGADLSLADNQGQTALIHSLNLDCSMLDRRYFASRLNFGYLLSKGANLSVGKIASGQLSRLARLDHDLDLLKLQVGSTVGLEVTWDKFVFVTNKRNILQFLIINGVMPSQPSLSNRPRRFGDMTTTSLLEIAPKTANLGVVKYLIATCFLLADDLTISMNKFTDAPVFYEVMNNLRSQPWPLVKLCFVAVSTAFGASPGRQERVKNSQLPPKIQNMLLFKEPSSRLCVHQWDKIPLTFSPEEYEKLPRPRPLLYHWPVGRALVPCDYGECDGTMCKYEGNE